VTAGVDWASTDHVACVVDAAGKVVTRFTAAHTADGLKALVKGLARVRAAEVAIERGDGLMAGALLAAGLTVVVISPNQVKNLRSRYGSAGNKDDRFDAFVLADTLRTDRARLRPLTPGTPATITLRSAVRARRDLVAHRVAMCAPTWPWSSPPPLACSPTSTPRSAWPSWPASTARTVPTGCRPGGWQPG
jgi:transposase